MVTHAHGDHLSWGSGAYLVASPGRHLAESRLGGRAVESIAYGERRDLNGVTVSLHPAGHILGSAQVRVEHRGEVWVVSGDYKTEPDRTCAPFEAQRCHTFVTESTFGLPVYRWSPTDDVAGAMLGWIDDNRTAGHATIILGYALGKAQRILSMLADFDGPIWTHGAVETMTALYRNAGVRLPPTTPVSSMPRTTEWHRGVVVAPPSVRSSPWLRRFGSSRLAFASGWMAIRGARRRSGVDRGFTVSDHVDWPAMLEAIEATGAQRVLVTHGFTHHVARFLTERGFESGVIPTRWEGEGEADDAPDTTAADTPEVP